MNTEKGNVIYREYQEKTFNSIMNIQHRVKILASYVQSDFERMLEDGIITKKDINIAIHDMDLSFDKVITELNKLREQSRDIMKHYGV